MIRILITALLISSLSSCALTEGQKQHKEAADALRLLTTPYGKPTARQKVGRGVDKVGQGICKAGFYPGMAISSVPVLIPVAMCVVVPFFAVGFPVHLTGNAIAGERTQYPEGF